MIARRGRLASGLRLPLDQVWPEPAPGHTGRLALWVGHEPASQMRQPAWPLLRGGHGGRVQAVPVRHHPPPGHRDRASLMFRNWLFGGQPGSGKTFAMRLLVLAAALDVRVELRGYELKGVGDFKAAGAGVRGVRQRQRRRHPDRVRRHVRLAVRRGAEAVQADRALRRARQGPGEQGHPRAGRAARLRAAPAGRVRGRDPGTVPVRQDRQGGRGDGREVHQAVPRAGHHPASWARRSPTRTACRPGSPATSTPGSACRSPTRWPTT